MPSATFGFRGNPASLNIHTSGNFTVPAGKYAHLTANVSSGGTCSLDSTVALRSPTWNAISQNSGNLWSYGTGTGTRTVSSGKPEGHMQTVGENAGPATTTTLSAVFANVTAATSSTGSFWVPTGTTINITGTGTATTQLFNI